MSLRDWIDFSAWRLISQHLTGVLPAILGFKFLAWVVDRGFSEGTLKSMILLMDGVVLVGLLAAFGWSALIIAWSRRKDQNGVENCFVVA